MKTWKRAGLYLIRKKARSILLILITFVMTTFIVAGNAMRTSANQQIEAIRQNLGSSFVVAADTQNESLYEEQYDEEYSYSLFIGRTLSPELIEEIKNVKGIKDYEIKDYVIVWGDLSLREGLWAQVTEDEYHTKEELKTHRKKANAVICGDGEMNVNFRTGALSISEGRNLSAEDQSSIVISEYLAKKNNLSIGDTIQLETKRGIYEPTDTPMETLGKPVRLKLIGIFSVNFGQEISMLTLEQEVADNMLFIDQKSGLQLKNNLKLLFPGEDSYSEVTFFVNDPKELESTMNKVKETVDLKGLKVSLDDSAYSASVKPLRQISIFSTVLMICGIGGFIVIFYMILSLWIKGRMHEIGILLSVGLRKAEIIWQMVLEGIVIVSFALILTIATAPYAVDLSFHAATAATAPNGRQLGYEVEMEYGEALPVITKVSSEKVKLTYDTAEKDYPILIVSTYAISSLSILMASIQIMKVSPKKLL